MACGETITEPLLVAAFDLGTTFSSYAFANRGELKDDPSKISSCAWCTGSQPGLSLKTPTCILFDKDQNFFAFGTEAEGTYTELAQEDDHVDWFYFRRFKMQLYNKQVSISCKLYEPVYVVKQFAYAFYVANLNLIL